MYDTVVPPRMDGGARMRLPNTAHTSRPWRIHEIAPDFRVEDVWALPTPGGPDDFPRLVQLMASGDPAQGSSRAARTLFAIRWKLGELLGWDGPDTGLGSRVPTLRDRLPADLRDAPGPDFDALPFTPLYLLDDEFAAEIANRTMHGVMHLGLVPEQAGAHRRADSGRCSAAGVPVTRTLAITDSFVSLDTLCGGEPTRPNADRPPTRRGGGASTASRRPSRAVVRIHVTDDAQAGERPSGLPSERRWAVLYDADCDFCTWLLSALLRWDRAARLHLIALQRSEADDLLQELTPTERMASWHLISPTGERRSGGAAVPPLLRVLPAGRLPAAALARFPRLTDRGYRWVAEHRSQLSKRVPASAKQRASHHVHQREQDRETP